MVAGARAQFFCPPEKMNRSFLIIMVPAIAVGLGYIFVLRWLGYQLEPFRFVMAGIVAVTAVVLVQRYQRRKGTHKGR
jgi:ABC-type spermidine/putrescine transport system permease subunit II